MKGLLQPARERLAKLWPVTTGSFPIGLDLGPDHLNLVQMESVGGKLSLRAIASLPYPCPRQELAEQPQELLSLLRQARARQPFKGKQVVSCLPADQLKIITISYHPVAGKPDAVPVEAELRERLKGDLDDMVVDFIPLRYEATGTGKHDALVALAPRQNVLTHLKLLDGAGLEVAALDIGPAALARLISRAGALNSAIFPREPNALLLNIGTDASFLSVIWGRRLMLDRGVDFSEKRLFTRLQQILDMPVELAVRLLYEAETMPADDRPDEAARMVAEVLHPEIERLIQEINKTLVYMASRTHGKSVDIIYLAGRVARYPRLLHTLKECLKVPVALLDPLQLFAPGEKPLDYRDLGSMAGIALTTGLALRGVPEHD